MCITEEIDDGEFFTHVPLNEKGKRKKEQWSNICRKLYMDRISNPPMLVGIDIVEGSLWKDG